MSRVGKPAGIGGRFVSWIARGLLLVSGVIALEVFGQSSVSTKAGFAPTAR